MIISRDPHRHRGEREHMIIVFEKIVNGKPMHTEIRCPRRFAETHIRVFQAAGWKIRITMDDNRMKVW